MSRRFFRRTVGETTRLLPVDLRLRGTGMFSNTVMIKRKIKEKQVVVELKVQVERNGHQVLS